MTKADWIFLIVAGSGVAAMEAGCVAACVALYRTNRNAARWKARKAEQ